MKSKQALLLGIIILVPVLAFLFLKLFGENRYELPTYLPLTSDTGEVVVNAKGDTVFRKIPDFTLTAHTGQPLSQKDLDGHIYVADFFFASCLGPCRKMSSQLVRVQEAFKDNPVIKLVSFTVDPERDSVEALAAYAEQYGAIPGKWYFLTGEKEAIYRLAQEGFYVSAMLKPGIIPDFIHSEKFMLIDKNKHVRGIYNGTSPKEVDRLITEINVLLHEYQSTEK